MTTRAETIMQSAEKRMDEVLHALRVVVYGGTPVQLAEYETERKDVEALESRAAYAVLKTPPPESNSTVRKRLIPNWGRRKLGW